MSKNLNKYIAASDYIDKTLIALSATSWGVSVISFVSVIGALVGIGSFSLVFSLAMGIIKELLNITRKKKKKYNKIFMLTSKLNSVKTLVSLSYWEEINLCLKCI